MKFDKEKLDEMVSMPDEKLWQLIVSVAQSYGFTLPQKTPPHSEMEKLRKTVTDGAKPNLGAALKIINTYRKGQKNG